MQFYLAIILFITSVVAGIIFLFVAKNISRPKLFLGCAIHFVLVMIYFISWLSQKQSTGGYSGYSLIFLCVVCSGIILCGMVWASKVYVLMKIYVAFYALTIPLFFFSPSMLINFLLTTKYSDTTGRTFSIDGKIFLEEQSAFIKNDSVVPNYKLIKKHGFFHQTIQRNISFAGRLDSIRVLHLDTGEKVIVRGFSGHVTFVTSTIDSLDVTLKLIKESKNQIERRF